MSIDLADYQTKAKDAIKAFWGNREAARRKQAVDTGDYSEQSEITGLKTLVTSLAGHVAAEAARSSA